MNEAEDGEQPADDQSTRLDWNGATARFWVEHADRYEALLAPHGEVLLAAAAPRPGERVLDIGCGCGGTTVRAAQAVGPDGGTALGVDISQVMIDRARSLATDSGIDNVRFEIGDAQTADLGHGRFDLAISRYGLMFFDDPVAALVNIRATVRPGGRLAFVCWAEQARDEHWTVTHEALAPHLGLAPPTTRPAGPFSLADPAHVRAVLADLRAAFAARERPDGVWLAAAAWLVRATAVE